MTQTTESKYRPASQQTCIPETDVRFEQPIEWSVVYWTTASTATAGFSFVRLYEANLLVPFVYFNYSSIYKQFEQQDKKSELFLCTACSQQ